ncbi:MAG: TorF family putative porin [Rhodospirillaceae bacterium]
MKKIALLSLAVMAIPVVAVAQDAKILPGEISGNVGIASDYTFRGISQTDEKPAVQGGIDWEHEAGLYLGVWGSNVDFNTNTGETAEIDVYGGWGNSIGAFSYSIGGTYYAYPGANDGTNFDFFEGSLTAGYTVMDGLDLGATYAYSPEYSGDNGDAHYIQASIDYGFDIGLPISLGATIGHQTIEDNASWGVPDYTDWSATASVNIDGVDLGVSYVDTSLSTGECFGGTDVCDARAVAFVTYAF